MDFVLIFRPFPTMKTLLLLRGDAFRQGRSEPIADIDQPEQLQTFQSALIYIVQPLEKRGYDVDVVVDIVVASETQEAQMIESAKAAFGDRCIDVRVSRERGAKQLHSQIALHDRRRINMLQYDVTILTRCDFMWTKSPLPSGNINPKHIMALSKISKSNRALNDCIFVVPRQRIDDYMAFFTDNWKTSIHDFDLVVKNVKFITTELIMPNTQYSANDYFYIVGRPRATQAAVPEKADRVRRAIKVK
jgi:hypothetical protein